MKQWQELRAQCSATFDNDARLNPIRGKMSKNAKEISLKEASQKEVPTEREKPAILAFEERRVECSNRLVDLYFSHTQNAVGAATLRKFNSRVSDLTLLLYQGKITYGDFATLRRQTSTELDQEMAQIQHVENVRRSEEQDRANRDMLEYGSRLLKPPSQSTTTDCTQMGNTFSCTTR